MNNNDEYDDIIKLDRPESGRPRMSLYDRAAQFSAFAALTGYDDAVKETARVTDDMIELDDDSRDRLDRIMGRIMGIPYEERPELSVTFFVPDDKKDGGAYKTVTGIIKKIDSNKKAIVMDNGELILIKDVADICEASVAASPLVAMGLE